MVQPIFNRRQEEIWFPVLGNHGFANVRLAQEQSDLQEATDAVADDSQGGVVRFALRSRNQQAPSVRNNLRQYKGEFTIRRARPSGALTEWDKVFTPQADAPKYLAYGWTARNSNGLLVMTDYVIVDLDVLRSLSPQERASCISARRTNTDRRRSEFVAFSIDAVARLRGADQAFPFRSANHPAFV